jgi:hypothetical protein
MQELQSVGHTFMVRGDFYGEIMLVKGQNNSASIVAVRDNTVVLVLTLQGLTQALAQPDDARTAAMLHSLSTEGDTGSPSASSLSRVPFTELKFHRVVGKGQFGSVRMAMHEASGQTFALKTLYKAPITDAKQVEHIINEVTVMQACRSPFCVQVWCPCVSIASLNRLQQFELYVKRSKCEWLQTSIFIMFSILSVLVVSGSSNH